ncbi:MAG TPA: flagellar motor switch protein FliM [Phycisphaerae bacterium]|jgi:flagellar motor switch protein FliM|nr:flagellar motor switch protein FliM [Phycisphaerae bacterium]
MPDVLDQSEVDALLAAVDSGAVKEESTAKIFSRSKRITDVEIRTYDFKRPERVSKDQMRALEALHEGFSRNFGAALSGYLRTIVEVSVANIEQLTFSEFIHALPNPTCFNLLAAKPLDGQMCLEISPLIIYPIIDRLLGGSSADLFIPQRPLTQIEWRLVKRLTDRALANLSEAWANILKINFELTETESNPQLVQIVPPNEVVVVIGFEIKMGNRAGTMSLCVPFNVIEPVMSKLSQQNWFTYTKKAANDSDIKAMHKNLSGAPLLVKVLLGHTTIKLDELMHLTAGDIVQLDKPASGEMIVQIEGKNKFAALIGQFKGKRAIRIKRPVSPGERIV